ncbi:14309_t:CDS:2, partial [Rhizophagus irregularis]
IKKSFLVLRCLRYELTKKCYNEGATFVVKLLEGNDLEIFKAHSDVLRGRSAYFDTALSPNWAKKEGNVFIFKKPNIRPDVFRIILLFIYNTIIDLDENAKDICELLIAADEINLNELIEYIHENITDLSYKNMISFFNALNNFTMYHQEIENIKEYVKKYIIKNAFRIFNNFDSLHSNYNSSTTILSRIRNERSAIYDSKDDKLGFGRDLRIFNRTCVFTNYERKIITPRTFNVEDYEVFEVERI